VIRPIFLFDDSNDEPTSDAADAVSAGDVSVRRSSFFSLSPSKPKKVADANNVGCSSAILFGHLNIIVRSHALTRVDAR